MEDELQPWIPNEELTGGKVISVLDMDAFELQIYLRLEYPSDWIDIYNYDPAVLVQAEGNV